MSKDREDRIEISLPAKKVDTEELARAVERISGEPLFTLHIRPVRLTRWQRIHNHAVKFVAAPLRLVLRMLDWMRIEEVETTFRRRGEK